MATEPVRDHTQTFTSEERIRQLADIDKNIAAMLRAAGEAVQALTNQTSEDGSPLSDNDARVAFTTATSRYFSLLSSVDVNVRRQIWALEEANIVAPGNSDKEASLSRDKAATDLANLGGLDVGWLNSRNDNVGKEMEAELWEKAKSLIALRNQESAAASNGDENSMHM